MIVAGPARHHTARHAEEVDDPGRAPFGVGPPWHTRAIIDQLRAAAEALNQVTQNHLLLCSRQTQSGGAFPWTPVVEADA
jgi:uncharacterized protein with LGFP repeats